MATLGLCLMCDPGPSHMEALFPAHGAHNDEEIFPGQFASLVREHQLGPALSQALILAGGWPDCAPRAEQVNLILTFVQLAGDNISQNMRV